MSPDFPAELEEITDIKDEDGKDFDVTPQEMKEIEKVVEDYISKLPRSGSILNINAISRLADNIIKQTKKG